MEGKKRKLTAKQQEFARQVAKGNSLADAYRAAYNAGKMKPRSIQVEASKLAADPDVTLMIEGLKAARDRAVVACSLSDTDYVLSRLRHFSEHATPQDAQRIRSLELLGKTQGLFKDVTVMDDRVRSSEDIRRELSEVLAKLDRPVHAPINDTDMSDESTDSTMH